MPASRLDSGVWDIRVSVRGRRIHRRLQASASAHDARQLEAQLRTALGQHSPAIPGDPQLTELLALYVQHAKRSLRSPETAEHHAVRIGHWLTGRRASQARQVAAEIVEDMTGHYAPATINRSLGTLKRALRLAWMRGATPTDYSALVQRLPENNQRAVYLSMLEVKAIADHASETVRAAIWIALLTGCRRGEICKIEQADIGRHAMTIRAGNTKTLRTRTVPIVPALRPWLKHLPLAINFEGVKSGFRRAREAAGMPHVHFHDLRHSCATILLGLRVPLHVVREILGHTSIKTTERYAHVMVQPQREALAKLGRMHTAVHTKPRRNPKSSAK